MPLTGFKLFDCTVKNVSTNIGYENQKTSVRIQLVEDRQLGDLFNPVPVGTPTSISLGNFQFTGLLQKYERMAGQDGKYTYDVLLEDPRDILDGCVVILNSFEGATSIVPNLLNVYGFYESTGFGNSLSNQAGMLWTMIKPAIEAMTQAGSDYGGPLAYKGITYAVDLSELTITDTNYRVGGSTTSLLALISEVCHDKACDFTVQLNYGTRVIKIKTISRVMQPPLGLLSNYIAQQTTAGNCIRSNIGVEARNEVCSKFLVGGQQTFTYQTSSALPYFGQSASNTPIIGALTDVNNPYSLTANLNALEISDILGGTTYTCNILEMMCADSSMEMWLSYIASVRPTILAALTMGATIRRPLDVLAGGNIGDNHNNVRFFNMLGTQARALSQAIQSETWGWKSSRLYSFVKKAHDEYVGKKYLVPLPFIQQTIEPETGNVNKTHDIIDLAWSDNSPLGINVIYNSLMGDGFGRYQAFVKYSPASISDNILNTYSNVSIDDAGTENNNSQTVTFQSITGEPDSLYTLVIREAGNPNNTIELTCAEGGDTGNLTLFNVNNRPQFTFTASAQIVNNTVTIQLTVNWNPGNNPGIQAFLFDNLEFDIQEFTNPQITEIFDLSRLPTDSYAFDTTSNGIYVKSDIEDKIYIYEGDNYCLVNISNPVHLMPITGFGPGLDVLLSVFDVADTVDNRTAMIALMRQWAGGSFIPKMRNRPMKPIGFAIPIQDNLNAYGPWYVVGASGKIEYEQDVSLTPWECGSYEMMNTIGAAKVSQALSFQQQVETGSFELVGVPQFNIGDVVVPNGPTISNIDIGYSSNGVTSTYRFHTFSNRFGVVGKNALEQTRRIIKGQQNADKKISKFGNETFRKLVSASNGVRNLTALGLNHFNPGLRPHTPSLVATMYSEPSTTEGQVYVSGGVLPLDEAASSWRADNQDAFMQTASMSLDGLFRPFSTDSTVTNMPAYIQVNASYTYANTVDDLDPFQNGNDVQVLVKGDSVDDLDAANQINGGLGEKTQRPICLKGPIILSSWGYSVDDGWVPNEELDFSGDILPEYLNASHKWGVGPMELLWDSERGVWTSQGHCMGVTQDVVAADGGSAAITLYEDHNSEITGRTAQDRTVYNFFGTDIPAETKVIAVWIPEAAKWYVVSADCA